MRTGNGTDRNVPGAAVVVAVVVVVVDVVAFDDGGNGTDFKANAGFAGVVVVVVVEIGRASCRERV